jgi:uncharacterized protein (TIGR02391 family)
MSDITQNPFKPSDLEIICKILADTNSGLSGSEIGHFLNQIDIKDVSPEMTKWKRLYNALVEYQNINKKGNKVLSFISIALQPTRYINSKDLLYDKLYQINQVLAFHGLEFQDDGEFYKVTKINNLSEAEKRVDKLKSLINNRNLHNDLLQFCRAELLDKNYFHAVLEATKSIAEKIRKKTNLTCDGSELIDKAFLGDNPILVINNYKVDSEISEQKGFANLLKGIFGMFRNPTAHSPKIEWDLQEEDAMDLFSIASLSLRRIDNSKLK